MFSIIGGVNFAKKEKETISDLQFQEYYPISILTSIKNTNKAIPPRITHPVTNILITLDTILPAPPNILNTLSHIVMPP